MRIVRATREKGFLKLAVTGPSGSGKTWAALGLAKGLSDDGRVLVIDSENGSASFYSGATDLPGQWDFDVINLAAPFTPEAYTEAIRAAVDGRYSVVVIDSLSHEWASSGGILDQKAIKDARGGNSFTNWGGLKQVHNQFVEALLQAPINVIATLRSKTEYVIESVTNKYGKEVQAPRKIGLAPISSDSIEFEFSCVFDLDRATHTATASKDRTNMFGDKSLHLNEQVGKQLRAWRDGEAFEASATSQNESPAPPKTRTRKAAKPDVDEPVEPAAIEQSTTSHEEPEAEGMETLSPEQQRQVRLCLQSYRIDTIAFLRWARSKGLVATDSADYGIEDIRSDQFGYLESLFNHERSRNQFIQHLMKTA